MTVWAGENNSTDAANSTRAVLECSLYLPCRVVLCSSLDLEGADWASCGRDKTGGKQATVEFLWNRKYGKQLIIALAVGRTNIRRSGWLN